MIEQIYKISTDDKKVVEKVIFDENLHYLHMVFGKGEGLPEHFSHSNVYMTVIKGILSIGLNNQDIHEYSNGTLLFLLSRPVSKQLLDIVREQVLLISCFAADSPIKYQ